jgi:hypothetical protein
MKTHAFVNDHLFINGVEITDYGEGDDVIKASRLNDAASHKMGADGRMAVAIHADRSGEITIKIMQTSPSNQYLSSLVALQGGGPGTFVPIVGLFQDPHRQDRGVGSFGYIKKHADVQRGVAVNEHEWTFVFERLDFLLGNPIFAGLAIAGAEAA